MGNKVQLAAQGATSGTFSTKLTGLTPSTTYYYRAYAIVAGTESYASQTKTFTGETLSFKTDFEVQKGAYLGCLEVPAIALASETASVKSGAAYYGRQHEFSTDNSSQKVLVMQCDDYKSTTGKSTGEWFRNYTLLYDNAMCSVRWVAYAISNWHFPMSSSMTRPSSWEANPSSTLAQYSGGYKYTQNSTNSEGIGYDRGHMIANMMRNKCSYNAQKQTFFHPNQIPQVSTFNQGKWVALENKELTWRSECDTMYVVTGPIFDQGYYTTPDKSGKAIPVATRCFKAMIKCKWTNGKLSEVKGIGFLMDNVKDTDSQAYTSAYTSIEEVEKACGFTLFTNLPPEFRSAKQNKTPSNFTTNW